MGSEFFEFLTPYGTEVLVAVVVLGVVGLVQWRMVRVAELEFRKAALGLIGSDSEQAHGQVPALRTGKGLIEQFGELSGWAKLGLLLTVVIVSCTVAGIIGGSISSHYHQERQVKYLLAQQEISTRYWSEQPAIMLSPERPNILLDAEGQGVCRIYLTRVHAGHDLHLAAVVKEQDNPDSEIKVEVTPTILRQVASDGGRYFEVKLQSTRGVGNFTLQVTASNQQREYAETVFRVRVAESAPQAK